MRNSLILKLMGAFMLVIAIGAAVISVTTFQATRNAFNLYTTRSGQVWAQRLAPDLADFYAQGNSWEGVDAVLESSFDGQTMPDEMGRRMGQGYGAGGQLSGGMMSAMGQRLILADKNGLVVGDTHHELLGKQISTAELAYGAEVTANNQQVGTLIVTPNDVSTDNPLASEFLDSVNQAILISSIAAGVISMALGMLFFLQIIKPLQQLKTAARAIASGDLTQRVNIGSRDELEELGLTFNQMAESLAKAETHRRHLVADVAHELRTPLTAIQGTLEGMQDGILPFDEEQVATLLSETMLLNRLVGDLKLLSLAEAGQLKLERQEIEPGIFFQQILERAKTQADQKNVRIITQLQPYLPVIWMDYDRITQVLNNLIGNAMRYTPVGGTISIRASLLPGTRELEVSVSDTGTGIDAEDLPYVFDRFYRADKSRTRASGGSGLGLAIVRQLVEAHGGKVRAESPIVQNENQPGFGTKISFTIPGLHS